MASDDRAIRDLAWCLHSPPLVSTGGVDILWPNDAWFASLECSAPQSKMPTPRHPHHFRLGQHFEALLAAWLKASPAFPLREANLQVQDGKRTVGEFDFLVEYEGEVEHWEAAVKFYLGTEDTRRLDHWHGPNTEDRFDVKLKRLVSSQLKLADNPHARALLQQRGINVVRRRCFMKGRLFYPWLQFSTGTVAAPDIANLHHERGWWLPMQDFLPSFENTGSRFVYLPKSLWLAPLMPGDFTDALSAWELQEFLASTQAEQATHVALVSDSAEISRGFIVTNQWIERLT